MSRLIALFIVGFIGLSLRFIILGEFEWNQLFLLLVFPIAAIVILYIMRWQYKKDRDFEPENNENHFITRLGDRVSTMEKKLYKDHTYIGSYQRYYHTWWKRIVADVMDHSGQWYLNLSFSLTNGDQVNFEGKRENKIHGNNEWIIHWNNKKVGSIRTDYSMNNAAKLKESVYLDFHDQTYHYQSSGMESKTEISYEGNIIATGKRIRNSVYQLELIDSDFNHNSEIIFMVYILFNYQFNQ